MFLLGPLKKNAADSCSWKYSLEWSVIIFISAVNRWISYPDSCFSMFFHSFIVLSILLFSRNNRNPDLVFCIHPICWQYGWDFFVRRQIESALPVFIIMLIGRTLLSYRSSVVARKILELHAWFSEILLAQEIIHLALYASAFGHCKKIWISSFRNMTRVLFVSNFSWR